MQHKLCNKGSFPEPMMVGVTIALKEDGDSQMTKHSAQNKSADEAPAATYESLVSALSGLHSENELREALREFVKRGATTARNRSADLHAGATKATGAIENVLVQAVSGVAEANRKVANAALQEIETACSTFDKLAGANSFDEAYKTYVDYLRHQNEVGKTRTKSAVGFVTAKASEAFDAFRDSATKFLPTWFRAA
jgi:hypothetical protein